MSPRLVRSEDIEVRLESLLDQAAQVGRDAEKAAVREGAEARRFINEPDLRSSLLNELRRLSEEEVIVAKPAAGETVIERREEDREIAKRALMRIKLPQLREIASGLGGRRGDKLEEVLERIVRAYGADQEKIARLVVEYEAEPPPERRFATRIFHVWEQESPLSLTASRAANFARRYLRTGVARWFVIEAVETTDEQLSMQGVFRYFQADATREDDTYRLIPTPANASANLRLLAGESSVEVDARGVRESRAIMSAFEHVSGLRWRQSAAIPTLLSTREVMDWDQRSVFLVDLLNARFRSDAIEIVNLNTAGFQSQETGGQSEEDESLPAVRAVKLDGRHLLESRAACELLIAGQGLVELGMLVRFRTGANEDFLIPLTIKQERDHTAILTGFGVVEPAIAHRLHTLVVEGVRQELRWGLADAPGLARLALQIQERAQQEAPVRKARPSGELIEAATGEPLNIEANDPEIAGTSENEPA